MFFCKKREQRSFDREQLRPVIRASICTGERVACFQERVSGKLHEVMLVRNEADFKEFCRLYGINPEEVETVN